MVKSGRNLDVEVAKKVLKLQVWFDHEKNEWLCYHPVQKDKVVVLPNYSTDSTHAYGIMHELQNNGFYCHVGSIIKDGEPIFRSTFCKTGDKSNKTCYGESLAHAICLAAIKLYNKRKKSKNALLDDNVIKFPKK